MTTNPNQPRQPRQRMTPQGKEALGQFVGAVVVVFGLLLVLAFLTSTPGSGTTVSCDSQNVPVYGECAP